MNEPPIHVELLFFDDCPSYKTVWNDLLEVIAEHRLDAVVRPVRIDDLDAAAAHRFAGSPTIKVNGRDLEGYRGEGVMACRVYGENGGKSWPSRSLLARRLLETKAPA